MKLEQAARQALEALEVYEIKLNSRLCNEAIIALRESLAEQAEQEPVAERFEKMHANGDVWITTIAAAAIARNAAPIRTKDLTDDEIHEIIDKRKDGLITFARAVIAADREKNKC